MQGQGAWQPHSSGSKALRLFRTAVWSVLPLLFVAGFSAAGPAQAGPPSLEALIGKAVQAIDEATQYTYTLKKRDRLVPGADLGPEEVLEIKFRKPDEIYLRTVAGPNKGREVLFSPARTGGRILGHEPWMRWPLRSVSVDPLGVQAMKYTHRPITEAEVGFCIRVLRDSMAKDRRLRAGDPDYTPIRVEGPEEVVEDGIPLYRFRVSPPELWHSYTAVPEDRTLFDIAGKLGVQVNCLIYYNDGVEHIRDFSPGDVLRSPYYCGKHGEFWLHRDNFFLYRQLITDWFGNTYEDYYHLDIRIDDAAGLTDLDFERTNRRYKF